MAHILRVSTIGALPGGEVWSVNPCWEIDGSGGAPVTPSQANTIATACAAVAVPTSLVTLMGNNTTVNAIRVEARSLTGTLESQGEATRATPSGGTGTNTHPHGTALVLSLRTPGVGPSARGRMYWPATGQALQNTDYRIAAAAQTSILSGFKTYLSGLETAIKVTLPNANLTVWSRKSANFFNVTSLQLGNVLDSQRRRRDNLSEGYASTTFP